MNPVETLETGKAVNPLKELLKYGQSVWLDYIRRNLITSGELKRLIEEDGLRGMTSNPSIFEKAIAGSTDYTDFLNSLKGKTDLDAKARYELLAIRDIQDATDLMRPVYDSANRKDGFVSLEVSPYLAHDTQGTIAEARRLWKAVGRDNVMIKVPGTAEGLPAIQQLISEGMNINVTLLFAQEVYEQVAEAYIAGSGTVCGERRRSEPRRQRGQLLHQPHRHADRFHRQREAEDHQRSRAAGSVEEHPREGRDCQREADLPEVPADFQRTTLGGTGEERRADATSAVGQYQHQESELPRRSLRRRTDRQRHGQHDSARDLRCISRSRQAAREPDREH